MRTSSTDHYADFDTRITEEEANAILNSYTPIHLETIPFPNLRNHNKTAPRFPTSRETGAHFAVDVRECAWHNSCTYNDVSTTSREAAMDITERKITKIAREAEKLVLRTMRETGVGTAEIDLIHALRHNPGCTQAALAELLHADKAAIARRTKNLEAKGYLVRRDAPNDRRSQLLYPTEKAESLKSSKAEIEAAFYEYLTDTLTKEEAAAFAAALNKLYAASKAESRAGFPHFIQAAKGENRGET